VTDDQPLFVSSAAPVPSPPAASSAPYRSPPIASSPP
jgi:hypothetical protein